MLKIYYYLAADKLNNLVPITCTCQESKFGKIGENRIPKFLGYHFVWYDMFVEFHDMAKIPPTRSFC